MTAKSPGCQERVIRRVGGNKEIAVDVRIISATQDNLTKLVAEGTFREDLFHRINTIKLQLPKLSERREDIPALVDYFMHRIADEFEIDTPGIHKKAVQILEAETWPEDRIAKVQHCIRAHRFRDDREQPQTIEAQVLFDADKLDAIGAIGAVRAIAYAVLDQQHLFTQPSERFLTTGEKENCEAHTPYHEHLFKLSKLKDRMFTKTGKDYA